MCGTKEADTCAALETDKRRLEPQPHLHCNTTIKIYPNARPCRPVRCQKKREKKKQKFALLHAGVGLGLLHTFLPHSSFDR